MGVGEEEAEGKGKGATTVTKGWKAQTLRSSQASGGTGGATDWKHKAPDDGQRGQAMWGCDGRQGRRMKWVLAQRREGRGR
jgi:hypothetical protein